jgi:hypothetical protein
VRHRPYTRDHALRTHVRPAPVQSDCGCTRRRRAPCSAPMPAKRARDLTTTGNARCFARALMRVRHARCDARSIRAERYSILGTTDRPRAPRRLRHINKKKICSRRRDDGGATLLPFGRRAIPWAHSLPQHKRGPQAKAR